MKNLVIAILCILVLGSMVDSKVHAQSAPPFAIQVTGTLANCPAIAAGVTEYCLTMTGAYQSISGGAYTLIGAGGAAPTLSINGVSKPLPASFTISASAPSTTAPTLVAK